MVVFPAVFAGFILVYVVFLFLKRQKRKQHENLNFKQLDESLLHGAESGPLETGKRIKIIFGTQTGTAEKFSKQLQGKLSELYGGAISAKAVDLEVYPYAENLQHEDYVFFAVATYGDGDPTDSAIDFDEWLSGAADSGEQILEGLKYGVFALGNTEYEHFCSFGKKVDRLVGQLGGERIVKRADGDDSKCIEDDFESWVGNLLEALDKEDGFERIAGAGTAVVTKESVPAYSVLYEASNTMEKSMPAAKRLRSSGGSLGHNIKIARVTEVRELHSGQSDRSCIHVELDISMSRISYESGDHVAVLPENSDEVVEDAAKVLGESLDTVFTLSLPNGNPKNLEMPFPGPISLRSALGKFADVTSAPQKSILPALAAFATDEEEAERLRFLASPEGKEEYMKWIHDNHMSLLELMQEFPSAKPSLGAFFGTICPRLQPRYYSISSSSLVHPSKIHITAAVVNERKPSGRIHKGVCTNWLKQQGEDCFAPVYVRRSHFKLPSDPKIPLIMVGPGTGLAPFRGFLQERQKLKDEGKELGPALLFFGCRHRDTDFIYQEELKAYEESGVVTGLHLAFSREQAKKDYVQHHLLAQKEEVWSLLFGERKGYFYVCGEAGHMAKDVHRTLHDIIRSVDGCSQSEAENTVKALFDQGRYQKDVW